MHRPARDGWQPRHFPWGWRPQHTTGAAHLHVQCGRGAEGSMQSRNRVQPAVSAHRGRGPPSGVPRVQRKSTGMASTRPAAYAKPHAGAHDALTSTNMPGADGVPGPAAPAVPSRGPRRHGARRRAGHHHATHRIPAVAVPPQRHHPHQHSTNFNLPPVCHPPPISNPSSPPPQAPRTPSSPPAPGSPTPPHPPFPLPHAAPSRHTMPTDQLPPPPPHLMPPRTA